MLPATFSLKSDLCWGQILFRESDFKLLHKSDIYGVNTKTLNLYTWSLTELIWSWSLLTTRFIIQHSTDPIRHIISFVTHLSVEKLCSAVLCQTVLHIRYDIMKNNYPVCSLTKISHNISLLVRIISSLRTWVCCCTPTCLVLRRWCNRWAWWTLAVCSSTFFTQSLSLLWSSSNSSISLLRHT